MSTNINSLTFNCRPSPRISMTWKRHSSLYKHLKKMWHGFSWKFRVILYHKSTVVWSKLTVNSMTIPCNLSRFCLFSVQKNDGDFGQVQIMEFPWQLLRQWWDSHLIWCQFKPNYRQKDMNKSVSHFLQEIFNSKLI